MSASGGSQGENGAACGRWKTPVPISPRTIEGLAFRLQEDDFLTAYGRKVSLRYRLGDVEQELAVGIFRRQTFDEFTLGPGTARLTADFVGNLGSDAVTFRLELGVDLSAGHVFICVEPALGAEVGQRVSDILARYLPVSVEAAAKVRALKANRKTAGQRVFESIDRLWGNARIREGYIWAVALGITTCFSFLACAWAFPGAVGGWRPTILILFYLGLSTGSLVFWIAYHNPRDVLFSVLAFCCSGIVGFGNNVDLLHSFTENPVFQVLAFGSRVFLALREQRQA